MYEQLNTSIAVIGIAIGKSSFHIVGLDEPGAFAPRQKWPRGQVEPGAWSAGGDGRAETWRDTLAGLRLAASLAARAAFTA